MSFISLWAGKIEPPGELSEHLGRLYGSIGRATFQRDPEVCAERELVPVPELLEPFSLGEPYLSQATSAAEQNCLRLVNTVVAVYTDDILANSGNEPAGCALRFVGTFPNA